MESVRDLVQPFAEFIEKKRISPSIGAGILEEVSRAAIRKKYGDDEHFDVIVNVENGDFEIWRRQEIVPDGEADEAGKIALSEARKVEKDFEVGEELATEIPVASFGRRAISALRHVLQEKIKNIEKEVLYQRYKDREGDMVSCEVYQTLSREVLLMDSEGHELLLPRNEQIPKDRFRRGETIRAIVKKVEVSTLNPKVILSRTSPLLLQRLLEAEVPEVLEGTISIKKVVRDPGERSKVAVESYDDRVDPVGACVGVKGSRIHGVVRELCNENIDVINYTNNRDLFVARCLSPAKILSTTFDEERDRVLVCLKPDQISLAIGRRGQNIRLASALVGMEIEVFRELKEGEEDVELQEFSDEIEEWIIGEFLKTGLDTAKGILSLTTEELAKRTDLEEETVKEVVDILKKEFE